MMAPPATAGDRRTRLRSVVAILLAAPVVVAMAMLSDVGGMLLLASYGISGLIFVIRRPGQVIGLPLLVALSHRIGTARPETIYQSLP